MVDIATIAIGGVVGLMMIAMIAQMVQAAPPGGGVIVPELFFDMEITGIETGTSKYATAYWNMQVTCKITNNNDAVVTRAIAVVWQRADSPETWRADRYWANSYPDPFMPVVLQPGESVTLVSPYYFINGWHDAHQNYEWDNFPPGMYHAGEKVKYNFMIVDDLGNQSPIASVGTYVSG